MGLASDYDHDDSSDEVETARGEKFYRADQNRKENTAREQCCADRSCDMDDCMNMTQGRAPSSKQILRKSQQSQDAPLSSYDLHPALRKEMQMQKRAQLTKSSHASRHHQPAERNS